MSTTGFATRGLSTLSSRSAVALLRDQTRGFELLPLARLHTDSYVADVPVLPQEVFRGALRRERKRAHRFEEPFLLLCVSLNNANAPDDRATAAVVAAIQAIRRDTDVIGWLRDNRILGAIVPAGLDGDASPDLLCARVSKELAARLDAKAVARLSVEVRIESSGDVTRCSIAADLDQHMHTPAQRVRATLRDAAKRALDIVGSCALLVLTAPLLLIVAALVKLTSSGPVLFRQERIGWTGQPFTMLKFRTMYVDVGSEIHRQYITQFIQRNETASASSDAAFKIANDPRVTRVGRILRKTSLDELPQFWNVLRGEMSLVGPRPPLRYEVDQYRGWHHLRVLEAKPGITGLWQVVGRSRTTFDEMVRLDVRYARTRSLWTDIKILAATPRAVITGKGAC